jgi:hypothetical protein
MAYEFEEKITGVETLRSIGRRFIVCMPNRKS